MPTPEEEAAAERMVDELASEQAAPDPSAMEKVDRQLAAKLERLEADEGAPPGMLRELRVLWRMFRASDDDVPWSQKALIMAALSYFVSPFDVLPDFAGKAGFIDDALIVGIVYRRLGDAVDPYAS